MYKKTIIIFLCCFMVMSGFSQSPLTKKVNKSSYIGWNLPGMIDNTYEFGYRKYLNRFIRFDAAVGGSVKTRGKFSNGNYNGQNFVINNNNIPFTDPNINSKFTNTEADYSSGAFGKLGLTAELNLSEIVVSGYEGAFKLYLGPIFGFANYNQTGQKIENIYYKNGTNETKVINAKYTESGNVFATGLVVGMSFQPNKDFILDFGYENLGYNRDSEFTYNEHVPGMGSQLTLRLNYRVGKK